MTRTRTAMAGTAALGAAVLVFVAAVLPPAPRALAAPAWQPQAPTVRGVFHVHTVRSDGAGTVDDVAAAAARVGLRFVIVTDHGDGTRPPDPPVYRSGVLCLDGVEISTNAGHYAAIGMRQSPYPLGGDPLDVIEDVARLGGFGVVTHPDSPKPSLAWSAWDAPFGAVEWLNADSEWRDESVARLGAALLAYPFRGAETVASLFRRPSTLARWDRLALDRHVIALAGCDAHAKVGLKGQADPYEDGGPFLMVPSYDSTFGAFSLRVTLPRGFSGRPDEDGDALLAAIRAGHLHTVVDAWARPGVFEFGGRVGDAAWVAEGDSVALTDALVLRARTNAPPGSRLVLFRDGREVSRVTSAELVYATNQAGSYRVEAWLPGVATLPMPWAVSNQITAVRGSLPAVAEPPAAPTAFGPVIAIVDPRTGWRVESDPSSSGTIGSEGEATTFAFELGGGAGKLQFAALVHEIRLPSATAALAFRASAPSPMRVSLQLRDPHGGIGERWDRTIYLDTEPRDFIVPLAGMRPAGAVSSIAPAVSAVDSLLLVVDRIHAKAGATGRFSVANVRVLGSAR